MELRHLRYFLAAAELENISRAALKLHVSQPAVSRQIRDLEDELGLVLFERGPKSLRLTAAGKAFQPEAAAVLARLEAGIQSARRASAGETGELQVGYAMSPTVRLMPLALREFQRRHPGVKVRLQDLSTEEMLGGLRDGTLHMAFFVRGEAASLRKLQWEDILSVPVRVAVPPGHPFAGRAEVTLKEVAAEPLLAYGATGYPEYHGFLISTFSKVRRKPRVVGEHDSVASLIASIEAGAGVALTPESIACFAGPRLVLIPLSPAPPPLTVAAAWLATNESPLVRQFLECTREARAGMEDANRDHAPDQHSGAGTE
jgi:DNA-binding transcriptional LysR family regulator